MDINEIESYINFLKRQIKLMVTVHPGGEGYLVSGSRLKKMKGMSIREYVVSLRLELAESLLLSTEESITDIAFITGFYDGCYFSNVFRKRYGVSPLKYRKQKIGNSLFENCRFFINYSPAFLKASVHTGGL